MSILVGAFVVSVAGFFFINRFDILDDPLQHFISFMSATCGGLVFLVGLLLLPYTNTEYKAQIDGFNEIRRVAEEGRASGPELEGAAFRLEVAEQNAALKRTQYWNGTIFDIWIPDEVMDLEPISVE